MRSETIINNDGEECEVESTRIHRKKRQCSLDNYYSVDDTWEPGLRTWSIAGKVCWNLLRLVKRDFSFTIIFKVSVGTRPILIEFLKIFNIRIEITVFHFTVIIDSTNELKRSILHSLKASLTKGIHYK